MPSFPHRLRRYAKPFTALYPLLFAIALSLAGAISCTGHADKPVAVGASDTARGGSDEGKATSSSRLRIMSYNVLKYGDDCQGKPEKLHTYLRSIIRYTAPDVVGLVKVSAKTPAGFDAKVRDEAMNAAFPGKYAVCPFTNKAGANNVNLLFYDQQKLGYAGMQTLLSNETDFNLYKLYLRASVTGRRDTAFLYLLLNHTESGDKSNARDAQMASIVKTLHTLFRVLPDMVDMGDFNLRNTTEGGYTALVKGDAGFRFSDPPFSLDHALKYPADWETDPEPYARFLTTSTRKNEGEPNDCGTGGGAKFWFDHILLSPSIAAGSGAFDYVPKSFKVVGNDGDRTGRSVNAGKHPNMAVPAAIAEALFQFSNKYPVMLELNVRR